MRREWRFAFSSRGLGGRKERRRRRIRIASRTGTDRAYGPPKAGLTADDRRQVAENRHLLGGEDGLGLGQGSRPIDVARKGQGILCRGAILGQDLRELLGLCVGERGVRVEEIARQAVGDLTDKLRGLIGVVLLVTGVAK